VCFVKGMGVRRENSITLGHNILSALVLRGLFMLSPQSGSLLEHRSQVAAEDDEIFYIDPTARF